MAIAKLFVIATYLLILMTVFPEQSLCRNASYTYMTTQCDKRIHIAVGDESQIVVNLAFNQAKPNGAACSWVIPAGNATMSNRVILISSTNPDALSCEKHVFSVAEQDPDTNDSNPLTLECAEYLISARNYSPVVGQPGFSILVTLNTTSALPENFTFMYVLPFVWTDEACPRNERKIIIARPGTKDNSETFAPASQLLSRFPDNLLCKWEFRSPDEGLLNLEIKTYVFYSDESHVCGGGDHFMVGLGTSSGPQILPLCKKPGVRFDTVSTIGSISVNMVSDNSGGAFQSFYFQYWSVESCPSSSAPLLLKAWVGQTDLIKGSSFSLQEAGQEQQCRWQITSHRSSVVKLYRLEAQDFGQNCHENTDYLLVNGRKVSICNSSSVFPVWSEDETMDIVFQSRTELTRRSFLLRYTAVYKSPCQGYPERKTVVGSRYGGDYVVLMPIPKGDARNGLVCQWLFTAKDEENAVRVAVDWAEAGSSTDNDGVTFNKETCSYPSFQVYNGNITDKSTEITPTCSADKSSIIYTGTSRDMLLVYRREPDVAESGFVMEVNQVRGSTSGNGGGKDVVFIGWGTMLAGLVALVLAG